MYLPRWLGTVLPRPIFRNSKGLALSIVLEAQPCPVSGPTHPQPTAIKQTNKNTGISMFSHSGWQDGRMVMWPCCKNSNFFIAIHILGKSSLGNNGSALISIIPQLWSRNLSFLGLDGPSWNGEGNNISLDKKGVYQQEECNGQASSVLGDIKNPFPIRPSLERFSNGVFPKRKLPWMWSECPLRVHVLQKGCQNIEVDGSRLEADCGKAIPCPFQILILFKKLFSVTIVCKMSNSKH